MKKPGENHSFSINQANICQILNRIYETQSSLQFKTSTINQTLIYLFMCLTFTLNGIKITREHETKTHEQKNSKKLFNETKVTTKNS